MSTVTIGTSEVTIDADLRATLVDIQAHAPFVAALLRVGTDAERPVVGLDWTVGQLGSHLAATADRYGRMAEGEAVVQTSIEDRRFAIDDGIDEHLHATAEQQAETFERGVARLVAALGHCPEDALVPYYGMQFPAPFFAGAFLGELLVHGVDLARTHKQPLNVPDGAAYRALLASCSMTSFVLTDWGRARTMAFGYNVRGHKSVVVTLDRGAAHVTHDVDRKIDAWFGGSATNLLLVSYGRLGALASLKTLRLRGRRPYLGLTTRARVRVSVRMRVALVVGLLTLVGCSSSAAKVDTAFRSRANAVCAKAVAARAKHPFPLQDFDPLHPTADDVAVVADYFDTYGQGTQTTAALIALGAPARGADAWKALRGLLRQSDTITETQIAAGRSRDVPAFVASVNAAGALGKKIKAAGEKAGFPASSSCAKVYT